jgi:hypothetical protein
VTGTTNQIAATNDGAGNVTVALASAVEQGLVLASSSIQSVSGTSGQINAVTANGNVVLSLAGEGSGIQSVTGTAGQIDTTTDSSGNVTLAIDPATLNIIAASWPNGLNDPNVLPIGNYGTHYADTNLLLQDGSGGTSYLDTTGLTIKTADGHATFIAANAITVDNNGGQTTTVNIPGGPTLQFTCGILTGVS